MHFFAAGVLLEAGPQDTQGDGCRRARGLPLARSLSKRLPDYCNVIWLEERMQSS